jgi:hypothetical protein
MCEAWVPTPVLEKKKKSKFVGKMQYDTDQKKAGISTLIQTKQT